MKRYFNESENKWYNEGASMMRQLSENSVWVGIPTTEQLTEWGYVEHVEPVVTPTPYLPTYNELVVQKIRERYTVDDELALQRQRDTKPDEFDEYNTFCEACKTAAREEVEAREEE